MSEKIPIITRMDIKFCGRCGRRLKSPEAIERGYGKICFAKTQTMTKPLFQIADKGVATDETV